MAPGRVDAVTGAGSWIGSPVTRGAETGEGSEAADSRPVHAHHCSPLSSEANIPMQREERERETETNTNRQAQSASSSDRRWLYCFCSFMRLRPLRSSALSSVRVCLHDRKALWLTLCAACSCVRCSMSHRLETLFTAHGRPASVCVLRVAVVPLLCALPLLSHRLRRRWWRRFAPLFPGVAAQCTVLQTPSQQRPRM